MKKYCSRKLKLLRLRRLDLDEIRKTLHGILSFHTFRNRKVKQLHDFISQNDISTGHYQEGLLNDFIEIIKNFTKEDIDYFFETIHFWDSYHLVVIADKLLDSRVKASVKYDFGTVYCRIFCRYEKLDSYYLVDNLEIAVKMYNSRPDLMLLIDLTAKLQLLLQNQQIKKQQFDYNLVLIKTLQNEL